MEENHLWPILNTFYDRKLQCQCCTNVKIAYSFTLESYLILLSQNIYKINYGPHFEPVSPLRLIDTFRHAIDI